MKDNDFCIMFLYSLINLVCFLLNVVYLTSLYNVRSQTKLLGIDRLIDIHEDDDDDAYSDLDIYKNSYTATATLFAFNFLGFFGFMIVLLVLINKVKVNRTDTEANYQHERQLNPNVYDYRTEERMGNSYNNTNTNNNNQNEEGYEKLIRIMLLFFLFSQLVFLIEIIVITVYHNKSSDLESEPELANIKSELDYFTKIYRDLIIVGYIFMVLFIIFDLIAAILTFQCGRRVKFSSNDMENLNEHKFCDCFSNCITNCCEKMAEIFNKCEREDDDNGEALKKKLESLEKKYEELNAYSENLRKLNEDISGNLPVDSIKTELDELNLPKSDVVMITQNIVISTKK